MSNQDFILFYTSDEPGARPFVRVSATPESLRYAGYLARCKTGRPDVHGFYAFCKTASSDISEDARYVQAGWFGYPINPGIPLGVERWIGGVWARYVERVEDACTIGAWRPCPKAPPPRS